VVRNSGRRKEFEEFKELQEFKNGSQESGGPGPRRILVTEKSFFKKNQSPSAYFSRRASWILAPDSWLLFSNSCNSLNSSNSFFLLLAEDAGSL
jgi:hypothetical protein